MPLLFTFIGLFFWFAFWTSQAGRSMVHIHPALDKWQDLTSWTHRVPEFVLAISLVFALPVALISFGALPTWAVVLATTLAATASLGGIESGTWPYLSWTSRDWPDKGRESTLKPFNDWLAGLFGWKLYDEGYSWVWAFTKGFIATLPVMGLGAITLPLCRELASHAKSVGLPGHKNFWMEFLGDGLAYTLAVLGFIIIVF